MPLPVSKKFPITYEVGARRATDAVAAPAAEEADAVTRVARKRGWQVTGDGKRWVVDAGDGRRIQVDLAELPTGGVLRFRRVMQPGVPPPEQQAELLRQNAHLAYAAYAIGGDARLSLVGGLMAKSVGDAEIDAVLRSIACGGEPVTAKPLEAFDRASYKSARDGAQKWEEAILREALGSSGISWQISGAHAVAVLRLEAGRKQTVHLLFDRADAAGDQLVQILSLCGTANTAQNLKALTRNSAISYVAIALAPFGGSESFVALRTQLAKTAGSGELLQAVTAVGQIADRIEQELTGGKDEQ